MNGNCSLVEPHCSSVWNWRKIFLFCDVDINFYNSVKLQNQNIGGRDYFLTKYFVQHSLFQSRSWLQILELTGINFLYWQQKVCWKVDQNCLWKVLLRSLGFVPVGMRALVIQLFLCRTLQRPVVEESIWMFFCFFFKVIFSIRKYIICPSFA